jgi:hypothetical protein
VREMQGNIQKKWTILIYANGNNDLEPEMWRTFLEAQSIGSNDDTNVIIQIGRAEKSLVGIIRPFIPLPGTNENWVGVRRYFLMKDQSILLADLGNQNMADPLSLYDFIKWGRQHYPAQQTMLVLGGHGCQFAGSMTDYSQEIPYLMGLPEMSQAIHLACQEGGHFIDLLVMDTCYFNFIEAIYELGQYQSPSIRYVLTYILNGPIYGLPYHRVIQRVQKYPEGDVKHLIFDLVNSLNLDLVAFEICHHKLEEIKKGFSELAACYLKHRQVQKSPGDLLTANSENPWNHLSLVVAHLARSLIVHAKSSVQPAAFLNVANTTTTDRYCIDLYSKLAFARNNYWTYLLSNETLVPDQVSQDSLALKPLVLSPQAINAYISIMNPLASMEEEISIFQNLVNYKKWVWK